LIKLIIHVDYPYPSRLRSFIYTALGVKMGHDYLKNSKIVAKMINESPEEIKAYWFFTSKTIPDRELLELLGNSKHEVALHIVKDPYRELELLQESTKREINYYTMHGINRLLARIMWKRWKARAPKFPDDFPLQPFNFPTLGLDVLCHDHTTEQAVKIAKNHILNGYVLHIHPIWLFQRGRINHRGPFYEALRKILNVNRGSETLTFRRKIFFTLARDAKEYERDFVPDEKFIQELRERGVDIFTFIERRWCYTIPNPSKYWLKANDNIALLHVTSYDEWWRNIGKKTRNMVRKAEKSGVKTEIAEPNEKMAEGIWKIYNETPIRQERGFPHYGIPLKTVMQGVLPSQNCTYIEACFQDELAGFVQLVHGDSIALISQILSLQKHRDKAVNNALVAKTVEVCVDKHIPWLMYGRIGNHPTLDKFKQNHGFTQFPLTRYYIPLTKKGKIATKLGLHREMKDALPQSIKYPLIPLYNWISRTKTRTQLLLKRK
jgi:hypothetical protein